jgi:TPR repeat protein
MQFLSALILAFLLFLPTLTLAETALNQNPKTPLALAQEAYRAKDWPKTHALLKPLLDANDPDAHFILANLHLEGNGTPQNLSLAHEHYLIAAKAYQADAMLALATLYSSGKGVPANKKIGYYWFEQAARFGNIPAQFMLGSINFGGDQAFAERNLIAAYQWYSLAAKADDLKSKRLRDISERMKNMLYQNFSDAEKRLADETVKAVTPLTRDKAKAENITFTPPSP